ncbi:MAG: pilus assembly protein PilP [Oceanospirillaceae bacterium]|nr:pilus assembly protein PilP [Oceanospirillaceae bacterium]|tara:strand:+ start:853 stop:1392 length:540 start_codon:yes stop_codon:yes gene_type:complete
MKRVLSLSVILLTTALSGCSQNADTSDLKQFVDRVLSTPRGRIDPIPVFKPYELFSYNASALRSPFALPYNANELQSVKATTDIRPDPDRAREYLEQFSLDNLVMVGTMQKPGNALWALVRDGNGGVVRVQRGEYMGQNHGRVVGITESKINLIEIVPNGLGGWLERPRALALYGQTGE